MFGSGEETLICFHGYGQDCTVFNVLEPSLGQKYTLISVDLPHQGKTEWKEKEKLTHALLTDLMTKFLAHVGASERISLLGYSIGGNYALGFAVAFKEKINDLWLIAADGLKRKPAFNFITKTVVGRWLFRSFILSPELFFSTARIIKKLGIVKSKTLKFYKSTVDTKQKRKELFARWSSTARISPSVTTSIAEISNSNIRSYLIFGRRDSVISYKSAVRFQKLVPNCELVLLDKGHRLLTETTNQYITNLLTQQHRQ